MPKKKKKDKGSSGGGTTAGDDPGGTSAPTPAPPVLGGAPTTTDPPLGGSGGFSSSLLAGGLGSSLNKPPGGASLLPPLKNPLKAMKETDPNLALLGNNEMAEMEQALEAHQADQVPGAMGGGMNVFAINKDGISRAVVKFIDKPVPMPLTVSFHFPGTFLTHRYVVAIIKNAIANIEGATVTHVQYMDRNVRLGTRGLENRWLVTVNDMRAKTQLILRGIKVVSRNIYVKSYDEVVGDEYREYTRYSEMQNRMKMGFGAKNKKLDVPGAGGAAASPSSGGEGADGEGGSGEGDEGEEEN